MKITSFGAAQTVTGSKHLLEIDGKKFLIDCGFFQGLGHDNPKDVPVELRQIDAIILTHGHLDHCGYIPKLVKHGFQGPIFATEPTIEIAKLIMADNAKIQAGEARSKNKHIQKESKKITPLYDLNDVSKTNALFKKVEWDKSEQVQGLKVTFRCAGHILGASSVLIEGKKEKVVFSGDLGRTDDQIMFVPKAFEKADVVVMECTYGDRLHNPSVSPIEDLIHVLKENKKKQGTVLIPAFSVARSQNVLFYLTQIFQKHPELKIPIYVDSPLTIEATKLYRRFDEFHKLSEKDFDRIDHLTQFIEFKSQRETLEINDESKVIVTASGMLSGGLAPHYLKVFSGAKNNTLMLVGYQAEGTLGREIVDGIRDFELEGEAVSWHGNVFVSKAFSSHADQNELSEWLRKHAAVKHVLLVHGEEKSLEAMAKLIGDKAHILKEGQAFEA